MSWVTLGALRGDLALFSREEFCGFVVVVELKYEDFFFFTGILDLDTFELEQSCALIFDLLFAISRLNCSYELILEKLLGIISLLVGRRKSLLDGAISVPKIY